MSLNEFVLSENATRAAKYQKDQTIELKILEINNTLAKTEVYLKNLPEFPTIFIYGLPRSGTTLTYQLISYAFEIGYINNIIARFWRAPLSGIRLSQSILGNQKDASFYSDYGKSTNPIGPHEFSYFWHELLNLKTEEDIVFFGWKNNNIDKEKIKCSITNIQNTFNLPIVFKAMEIGNNPLLFSEILEKSIFIYIERDLDDVALSILKARHSYYNNSSNWWATYPQNYYEIKDLSYDEQISNQILNLSKMYKQGLSNIHFDRKIIIQYNDLCRDPKSFLFDIQTKIKNLCGYDMKISNKIPDSFELKDHKDRILNEEEKKLLQTLHRHIKEF